MAKKHKQHIPVITIEEKPVRRARCTFCGGRGDSLKAETVTSPEGLRYRIPESHTACKESVLSLSLSLWPGQEPK